MQKLPFFKTYMLRYVCINVKVHLRNLVIYVYDSGVVLRYCGGATLHRMLSEYVREKQTQSLFSFCTAKSFQTRK